MRPEKQFVQHLRSRFLDAVNNHLMQIQTPNLGEYYETKEALIEMLSTEAGYLQQKRDAILSEINAYLSGT
ncbi:MAG: hypothetical protein K9M82_12270 [Deltaproteobacteria bacterium]|nr:hypothetical protein [Deltaproteobacteria bacterium]